MYFPKLKAAAQQRAGVEQFGGLDRRPGSGAGSLEHMENLWSSGYPALETRPLRRTVTQLTKPNGMTEKDGLFWVDGTALYVNGAKTGLVLTDSRKQLVSMGAYLLIFPDKKYINTQDLTDFGSMENVRTTTGEVTFTLCDGTGESLGSYAAGTEAPQEPQTGDLWLDTERSESVMRRYDGSTWTALAEVYTKIAAVGVGLGFRAGDGVTVAGCGAAELNGLHILQAAEDDWVLVPALCRTLDSQTAAVTVMRLMPEMDFVVEQGNRLWGCKYGIVDGQAVNEIYACALGDFRNWNSFAGLSTDSYAAARGSDGPFTGVAACMGGVVFFKENCMERIYPAAGGGHQIVTVPCSGVRKGAERTVAVADGVVYYLGNDGVYAFDGSMPVCVSRALGDKRYTGGVAGGDITQGLPRVEELFEARKPKKMATIAEIGGKVRFEEATKGSLLNIIITADDGDTRTYAVPHTGLLVQDGEVIEKGRQLQDGALNPHDVLRIRGASAVHNYLIQEVLKVYRQQGVDINDKHIEVIVRQMMRKVRVEDANDAEGLLSGAMADVMEVEDANAAVRARIAAGEKREDGEELQEATYTQLLMGITKASLATDSFLSAASFQETTKVLTEAAIKGKVDHLVGLKENVIIGKLIPAGAGLTAYRQLAEEMVPETEAEKKDEAEAMHTEVPTPVEAPADMDEAELPESDGPETDTGDAL